MSVNRKLAAVLLAVALSGGLGACGSDGATTGGGSAATTGNGKTSAAIQIDGAWARTSPSGATTGAAYLKLTSSQGDALIGAAVDPSVARSIALHETTMAGHDMTGSTMAGHNMSGTTMAGMSGTTMGAMTMQPVDRIELPKGQTVVLAPGGYHLMMEGLAKPLEKGSILTITLIFEKAGKIDVKVPVQDAAP